ncbi:hypothetical protein B0H14DRAFT_2585316 [Mycena olivaceomarginata]|nr:hypothetical protein B0H14DRAFT_2585316 [Mycena olivaceomarginata]
MPKQINSDLGSSSKKWAISMYMTDIKSSIVTSINVEWLRNNTIPIDDDEVSIRWFKNRVLDADTATMTLGDFYAYYSTPSKEIKLTPPRAEFQSVKSSNQGMTISFFFSFERAARRAPSTTQWALAASGKPRTAVGV